MRRGVKMWTSVSASSAPGGGPHMITADVDTGSGTVYLSSPKAKAKVVEKDVYACKVGCKMRARARAWRAFVWQMQREEEEGERAGET